MNLYIDEFMENTSDQYERKFIEIAANIIEESGMLRFHNIMDVLAEAFSQMAHSKKIMKYNPALDEEKIIDVYIHAQDIIRYYRISLLYDGGNIFEGGKYCKLILQDLTDFVDKTALDSYKRLSMSIRTYLPELDHQQSVEYEYSDTLTLHAIKEYIEIISDYMPYIIRSQREENSPKWYKQILE